MKQIPAVAFALVLSVTGLQAQERENQMREGFSLLQQGSRLLLEGLIKQLGPALLKLEGRIIDLNAYQLPEMLPNGDIIIRRKAPVVPLEEGEIEL